VALVAETLAFAIDEDRARLEQCGRGRKRRGDGGSRRASVSFCGAMKRSSGPSARSPFRIFAPSASAILWPSPVAVRFTPSTLASCGPMKRALSSGLFVKSPVARTTPPRAVKVFPSAVSTPLTTILATRVSQRISTPSLRARRSR
jgi:hypothetical protein